VPKTGVVTSVLKAYFALERGDNSADKQKTAPVTLCNNALNFIILSKNTQTVLALAVVYSFRTLAIVEGP
jgi:hypothetical protein